jgi:hypothetical protein
MLKDEPLEYIQEQFEEKTLVLSQFGERVSATTMYEDIFGNLEQVLPVVIIDEEDETEDVVSPEPIEKHIIPMTLAEALEQSESRNDMLLGGCSYFNNWISKRSAKDVYTFIVDMDNVYSGTLLNALQQDWYTASGDYLPKPTYIVNSGTGCHLYFVLQEPIPNYKITTPLLDKVYRALAVQQTTRRVYLKKEVQWFGQDFRIAGGLNKYKWENQVFRVGEKWDIDELAKAVGLDGLHFVRYGEKRTTQAPVFKEKRVSGKGKGWKTNRAFYDYALRTCREKTKEGNRYTSMCALSVIAWKCAVSADELERDLHSLLPSFNKGAMRVVKEREVYSAMKMYNAKAILTQRERLELWQGWEYKPIKRNGRKQADHLRRARAVQNIDYPDGEWRGRKPTAEALVHHWQSKNPAGRKVDCARELNIDPKTVRKWWL